MIKKFEVTKSIFEFTTLMAEPPTIGAAFP
jgi:hypothetical protein